MSSITEWIADIEEEYGSEEQYLRRRGGGLMFYQTHPNSHFWTNLTQLQELLKHPYNYTKDELVEFLRVGIENTINNGYNLKKMDNIPNSGNNYKPIQHIHTEMHNIDTKIEAKMLLEACLIVLNTVPNKEIETKISKTTYELAAIVQNHLKQ